MSEPDREVFRYEFRTDGRKMLFIAIAITVLAAVLLTLAIYISYMAVTGPGDRVDTLSTAIPLAIAFFCSAGAAKVWWDCLHPKSWTLVLSERDISWITPTENQSVNLTEISHLYLIDDDESPRLRIDMATGRQFWVNPNCLGDLESFRAELKGVAPDIRITDRA